MPDKQQSLFIGSIVVALLSTSYIGYINLFCCIGVVIGALVAVWHYTNAHRVTLKAGPGAMLGMQAGLIGAVIALFLNFILIQLGVRHDHVLVDMLIEMGGATLSPEQIDDLMDQRDAPVRLLPHMLQGTLGVLLSGAFGAIGGAIGSAIFKKGEPEAPTDQF